MNPDAYSIATMTATCKIDSFINVKIIGKFLKLNDIISEIRFRDTIKRGNCILINNKKSFYNQVTVLIKGGDQYINMKIFPNGQIQMTGCKKLENIEDAIMNLKNQLIKLDSYYCVNVWKNDSGLVVDKDGNIYGKNNIIGFIKNETISMNNEIVKMEIINNKKYFVSDNQISKIKYQNIYNNIGKLIGNKKLILDTNKKIFYKNYTIVDDCIFNGKDNQIGKIETLIDTEEYIDIPDNIKNLLCKMVSLENKDFSYDIKIANINGVYGCNESIDRQILANILKQKGIFVKYDPNTYPGINVKYIFNNTNTGICNCDNKCRWVDGREMGENSCKRISIFIFQSGKVIITGGNSKEQIDKAYHFINNIISENYSDVCTSTDDSGLLQYMD